MADELPPDLDRLGDELIAAARRQLHTRRRRVRLAVRGILGTAAALAVAITVPGVLAPAELTGIPVSMASFATGADAGSRPACDQVRPATFAYPEACREAWEDGALAAARRTDPLVIAPRR